ncbi:MAG: hypothetical protein ACE5GW_13735 [Planctomycetota bacterium]
MSRSLSRRRRRLRIASGDPGPTHRQGRAPGRARGEEEPELSGVIVELQELGREIEARLDTRVRYMKRLLAESEELVGRLEAASARAREQLSSAGMPPAAAAERSASTGGAAAGENGGGDIGAARAARPAAAGAPEQTGAVPQEGGSTPATPSAEALEQQEIARLAGEGRSAPEIATAVGRPLGEVELILKLRKQAESAKKP